MYPEAGATELQQLCARIQSDGKDRRDNQIEYLQSTTRNLTLCETRAIQCWALVNHSSAVQLQRTDDVLILTRELSVGLGL